MLEACDFVSAMVHHGIECVVFPEARAEIAAVVPDAVLHDLDPCSDHGVEIAVVFGGDGTILRAAEWTLTWDIPVLGVNLGHVGFLAELEVSQIPELVRQVVKRDYRIEKRLTVLVEMRQEHESEPSWTSFAVNEVSLEKASRQKMIEVLVHIDGLPVSRWSCDGVLVSTPTGSTAYAFSAGGPVMWPELEAYQLVPLSAHALFARPLVLSPESVVTIDLMPGTDAVVWCDGRRSFDVEQGSRLEIRRSPAYLKVARLSVQPFTSRLVKKFGLRIEGFRGEQGD